MSELQKLSAETRLYCAPLEGLTDRHWRKVHAACFGGVDRYFTPFLAPTAEGGLGGRELREAAPESGIPLVPQLLVKSSEVFLKGSERLSELGYREFNLNLGCPSGTVTAKGKGSALLRWPETLTAMLEDLCGRGIPLSVKSRIGWQDPEEAEGLYRLFSQFPLTEVICHPRTTSEKYSSAPHTDSYSLIRSLTTSSLIWNGSFLSPEDVFTFLSFVQPQGIMCGRGLLADPALFRELRGGAPANRKELLDYSEALTEAYVSAFGSEHSALFRMKEHWSWLRHMWVGSSAWIRPFTKAKTLDDLRMAVRSMDSACDVTGRSDWTSAERWTYYCPNHHKQK